MSNDRYNTQNRTKNEPATGKGVLPKTGEPQKSELPMRVASWPGLPGPAQKMDRSNGVPEEKVYAQATGLRGGKDDDSEGPSEGESDPSTEEGF